jgi:hypothetical protein
VKGIKCVFTHHTTPHHTQDTAHLAHGTTSNNTKTMDMSLRNHTSLMYSTS